MDGDLKNIMSNVSPQKDWLKMSLDAREAVYQELNGHLDKATEPLKTKALAVWKKRLGLS